MSLNYTCRELHSVLVTSVPCPFADGSFLRTLASSLIDFNELSSVAALNMLLEVGPSSGLR